MKFPQLLLGIAAGIALPGLVHAVAPVAAPAPAAADKIQIAAWINATAQQKVTAESLSFQFINLDDDKEPEIVAKENGAVHIGNFYILDQLPDHHYALIAEKPWNVPQLQLKRWDVTNYEGGSKWNSADPDQVGKVAGKRLFETIDHTGGTGLDVYAAHLWYLEKGSIVEAWSGVLQETSFAPGGKTYRTIGSYQLTGQEGSPVLYHWLTQQELDPETMPPLPAAPVTKTEILPFADGVFQASPSR